MEELHKIEKPTERTFFIAYNEDDSIKSYDVVDTDQCMETKCARLETYTEDNKPALFDNLNNEL